MGASARSPQRHRGRRCCRSIDDSFRVLDPAAARTHRRARSLANAACGASASPRRRFVESPAWWRIASATQESFARRARRWLLRLGEAWEAHVVGCRAGPLLLVRAALLAAAGLATALVIETPVGLRGRARPRHSRDGLFSRCRSPRSQVRRRSPARSRAGLQGRAWVRRPSAALRGRGRLWADDLWEVLDMRARQ